MNRDAPQEQRDSAGRRDELEKLFLEHLDLVERAAASAARRAGLAPQDVEDFVSTVKLKLIEDDYAVLRKHRGESRLSTYLVSVVHHRFKDYLNHKFGKYRPSATAKKLGPAAVALERMLIVEKRELEAAIQVLLGRSDLETSRAELERLAEALPVRPRRSFTSDDRLSELAAPTDENAPERRVEDAERRSTAEQVEEVLSLALATLSPRDLLILKMFFRDGQTIAEIAKILRLEQRPLYTRKAKSLKRLRTALESAGLTWEGVRGILGWKENEIRPGWRDENGDASEERP